jgi:putative colanic acid biosynthesis acetyltransferase WcaF
MGSSPPPLPDFPLYNNRLGWRNRLGRSAWWLARVLVFRPTPRCLFAWRRLLLRVFGARIGAGAHVYPSARIWAPWNLEMGAHSCLGEEVDCYSVDRIIIGAHATVSQNAFLCTASHDIADPAMRLVTKPVTIGARAWVCARAYVGPGVSVGEGAVVAACAVAPRDVAAWTVVGGNPAREIGTRARATTPGADG